MTATRYATKTGFSGGERGIRTLPARGYNMPMPCRPLWNAGLMLAFATTNRHHACPPTSAQPSQVPTTRPTPAAATPAALPATPTAARSATSTRSCRVCRRMGVRGGRGNRGAMMKSSGRRSERRCQRVAWWSSGLCTPSAADHSKPGGPRFRPAHLFAEGGIDWPRYRSGRRRC